MELDVGAGDGENGSDDASYRVSEVVEFFDEGVRSSRVVRKKPEGGRIVGTPPADGVNRNTEGTIGSESSKLKVRVGGTHLAASALVITKSICCFWAPSWGWNDARQPKSSIPKPTEKQLTFPSFIKIIPESALLVCTALKEKINSCSPSKNGGMGSPFSAK